MFITFNILALKQIRDLEKRQILGIKYLNYCLKSKFWNFEKLAPRGAKFGIYMCQILDTPQIHLNSENISYFNLRAYMKHCILSKYGNKMFNVQLKIKILIFWKIGTWRCQIWHLQVPIFGFIPNPYKWKIKIWFFLVLHQIHVNSQHF